MGRFVPALTFYMNTKLYFVPTPIGNLKDITLRAIDVLNSVDIIYAEDTRKTLQLLNHLKIKKTLKSYHKDNEQQSSNKIINEINNEKIIAVVSDAGTPAISDPGNLLIKKLLEDSIKFEVLPGATAFVPALLYSGFSTENFYFAGFLPYKQNKKNDILKNLASLDTTIIIYESPHKIKDTLKTILNYFNSSISVSREISKIYEETVFIKSKDDIEKIKEKGEFVIIIDNNKQEINKENLDYQKIIEQLHLEGFSNKDILKILKTIGLKRNQAYELIEKTQ
jgi:16S rRNA (cytidine1402-2'-O)-methyltransferase